MARRCCVAQPKITRVTLATLPTPLEAGGKLPSGANLWVKRDDLTGLGVGGNKARKLEFLCAEAIDNYATCLVTVGAAQSNHCRMTAAAGARPGPVGLPPGPGPGRPGLRPAEAGADEREAGPQQPGPLGVWLPGAGTLGLSLLGTKLKQLA